MAWILSIPFFHLMQDQCNMLTSDDNVRLVTINYRDDDGRRQSNRDANFALLNHPITTPIRNGRVENLRPSLATHGFELIDTAAIGLGSGLPERDDYNNPAMVRQILYPWCEELVMRLTGAPIVRCFHHLVRGRSTGEGFAAAAHSDYTTHSAHEFFKSTPMSSEFPHLAIQSFKGRYAVFNLWKNISSAQPIRNHHLALCDATSVVAPDDIVVVDSYPSGQDRPNRVMHLSPCHHRRHRWYYFPDMTHNECLVFTQYDSDPDRPCRYTFHTSVTIPDAPAEFPRESIEVRLAAWFPDAMHNTIPDFSILPSMRVVAARHALRDMLSHFKSWSEEGRRHITTLVEEGAFDEIVRSSCEFHRKEGNRAEFKDLTDNDIIDVVRSEMASGFVEFAVSATGVVAHGGSPNHARVTEAARTVTSALQHIAHWDASGKTWVAQCLRLDNFNGLVRGVCKHQRQEKKTAVMAELTAAALGPVNNSIHAVVDRLSANARLQEDLRKLLGVPPRVAKAQ